MPRIPVILSTQGIAAPQGPSFPRGYNPDAGTAEAIAKFGQTASDALFRFADERQREDHQEAGLLASEAEMRIGVADAQLRTTQRDPEGYQADHEQLLQQTVEDIGNGAKRPGAAALMRARLIPVLNKNRIAAAQHVETLRTDQSVATVDAELDNRKQLAGLALSDTDFQRQYEEGANAIKIASGITADKKGDLTRKFREDVLGARALREANESPEVFAATADVRFAAMDPKRREELKQHAEEKAKTYRKERNHIAEAAQKDLEETYKADVRSLVSDFDKRAAEAKTDDERAGVLRDLNMRQDLRQVEGEDYRRIRAALEAPRDTPSDPGLLTDASVRANRATPSISEAELDRMRLSHQNGGRGLNQKDYMELKGKVISRADHLKAEGLTERDKRHNQAEQILARGLGISSLYDKIDEQDKQLNDIGLRELTARSNAFNPRGEDPLAVAAEFLLRVQPMRQERLKLKVPQIGRTLRFPAVDSETADRLLTDAITRGQIVKDSPEHRIEQRKIIDMLRAEVDLRQSGTKTGDSLGRKAGDKPQQGKAE